MGIGLHKLRHALRHPLARDRKLETIKKFVQWKLGGALNPNPLVYPFVHDTMLLVNRRVAGDEMNLLTGLGEFAEMAFVLHLLRPQDLFADVGANIGSYSILASGVSGAHSIAVEPVPETYGMLLRNIALNGLQHLVNAVNMGA